MRASAQPARQRHPHASRVLRTAWTEIAVTGVRKADLQCVASGMGATSGAVDSDSDTGDESEGSESQDSESEANESEDDGSADDESEDSESEDKP